MNDIKLQFGLKFVKLFNGEFTVKSYFSDAKWLIINWWRNLRVYYKTDEKHILK